MSESAARFVVGVDLGTSHTVVAFADRRAARVTIAPEIKLFPIVQPVSAGASEARTLLPSTLLHEASGDGDTRAWIVGEYARARGAELPSRFIASSKSWLAHAAVDRQAAILPWGFDDEEDATHATHAMLARMSPVDAATAILKHIRDAWDDAHPDAPLARQDVVLTLPASFDEGARALTVEASVRAGLVDPAGAPVVRLLEEPQAALLDWARLAGDDVLIALLGDAASRAILVCDVGGGTTDLSLVTLSRDGNAPGGVTLARVAVGDHLLLGGDNLDLALARALEPELAASLGAPLSTTRFSELVLSCRAGKERLLADGHEDEVATPITLLGRGGRLVGGALKATLTRDRVEHLLDGFFPNVTIADATTTRARRTGMVSLGLPYAQDPAITRHVARFLAAHAQAVLRRDEPLALLLNGGVFHARAIVSRVAQAVESLTGARPILLGLDAHRGPQIAPDLAVARGAVAHGLARDGVGRTIGGGSARSLFVALGDGRALCVSPKGAPSGVRFVAGDRKLALLTGATARFDLFSSAEERTARAGDVVEIDARFDALPSVVSAISARAGVREIPVTLQSELTEIGTLDLFCVEESGATHRLAFELRARVDVPVRASLPPQSRAVNDRRLVDAIARIDRVYGRARKEADPRDAKALTRDLEKLLGPRDQWTVATLRPLADALLIDVGARKRSPEHERAFWSLAGYLLRPGFGDPRDADRIRVVAPLASQLLTFGKEDDGWRAWWIAWRRLAGGLDEATQSSIRDVLDPFLELPSADVRKPKKKPKNVRAEPLDEVWRLAGALERVPTSRKVELGAWILDRTWTSQDSRLYEALGRLGARVPTYASVHHVVPGRTAERWLEDVLRVQWSEVPAAPLASVMIAQRTGDRAIDVSDSARQNTLDRLIKHNAKPEWIARVRDVIERDDAQRRDALGDDWPIGLRLIE